MKEAFAIGIDIGGTNTSYGIVNKNGDILHKGKMLTAGHETVEDFITALSHKVEPLIHTAGTEHIRGIGIGVANGNFFTGEVAYPPNLPWKDAVVPLAGLVGDVFNMPCTLTNDANAAALGEMMYGAARNMRDFVMVTLGTGLGSGFVANGALIYGHDGFAGELGHVTAIRHGRLCGCGRRGCLEAYCSATGIVATAEEWLASGNEDTVLREHAGRITAKIIQEAAENGDIFASDLFAFTGKILGQVLADITVITSPEAFIFFGGLARAGDLLLPHVQQHMEDNMLRIFKNKVSLLLSALPDADAAILGASALVW